LESLLVAKSVLGLAMSS